MPNDQYAERTFKCKKKAHNITVKRYKWDSDATPEICECGSKMVEVFKEVGQAPAYGRIASMSPSQRQEVLKKRSKQHFKTHIRERKYEIQKQHHIQERKKYGL